MRHQGQNARLFYVLIAGCMLLARCVNPPHYEEIDKLRVLAIRSDKPQLTLGETANMDALVVTPDDAPVTLSWQLCAYVKSADTKRACPKEALLQKGAGDIFSFTVTETLATSLEPLCMPDEALLKRLPEGVFLPECTDAGYPVVIRLTAKTVKETQVAVKKILVAHDLGETRLENPNIVGFDNLPTSVHPDETYLFSVEVDDSPPQPIATDPGPGNQVSDLRYTWFILGADVEYMLDTRKRDTPEEVHLKIDPEAARVSIWIVIRNAMYGVDWRRLDFDLK